MEKDYNLDFESHPTSKDVGFHGTNKKSLVESEMFSPGQISALSDAFRAGIGRLYYGVPDDY